MNAFRLMGFLAVLLLAAVLMVPGADAQVRRDLHHNMTAEVAIASTTVTTATTVTGATIDTNGYGSLEFVILTGSMIDAATWTVTIQSWDDADAMSDLVEVSSANLLGATTDAGFLGTDDNEVRFIGYTGRDRYVRIVLTVTGNTNPANVMALAILGHPYIAPVR